MNRLHRRLLPFLLVLAVSATIGPLAVFADSSLVQVTGESPFGALENCGDTVDGGTVFLDSEVEPWLDVNPTNSKNLVGAWQQDRWSNGGARSDLAGVSFDGGKTWDTVVIPGITECAGGDFDRASDPWVSFGPDGALYHVSLSFDITPPPDGPGGFGPNALLVSKSEDGGMTWSDPSTVIFDDDPSILNDKETITADPDDANLVYVVWDRLELTEGDTTATRVFPDDIFIGFGFQSPFNFARSMDGGMTWERQVVYDPGPNNQTLGHQLLVLPDGTLVDFFNEILNFRNDDGGDILEFNFALLRSPDKGTTWGPVTASGITPIRAAKIQSLGAVNPDNPEQEVRDAFVLFDVALDRDSGRLYAVWQDARFSGGTIDEIAFSTSADGGLTWTEPVKINQTPFDADNPLNSQAWVPSVHVNSDGTIGVTYYDFRNNGEEPGALTDHWFISCQPGRMTDCTDAGNWKELRVTEESFDLEIAPFANGLFLGDYVGLSADGNDFLPFFSVTHDDDPATVFFKRIKLGAGPGGGRP